jgi:hypothetical protein
VGLTRAPHTDSQRPPPPRAQPTHIAKRPAQLRSTPRRVTRRAASRSPQASRSPRRCGSVARVYWVGVPKALRARRVNRHRARHGAVAPRAGRRGRRGRQRLRSLLPAGAPRHAAACGRGAHTSEAAAAAQLVPHTAAAAGACPPAPISARVWMQVWARRNLNVGGCQSDLIMNGPVISVCNRVDHERARPAGLRALFSSVCPRAGTV